MKPCEHDFIIGQCGHCGFIDPHWGKTDTWAHYKDLAAKTRETAATYRRQAQEWTDAVIEWIEISVAARSSSIRNDALRGAAQARTNARELMAEAIKWDHDARLWDAKAEAALKEGRP